MDDPDVMGILGLWQFWRQRNVTLVSILVLWKLQLYVNSLDATEILVSSQP